LKLKRVRTKTVQFYILNSRGLLLGSPEGYPTIDFLHIQPKKTTFDRRLLKQTKLYQEGKVY